MEEIIAERYRLIKLLGRGSFGSVHLAEDLKVGHRVVVKLSGETLDEGSRGIFEREASVAARLSHPNITTVFDFGITTDNRSYIVREYVEGDSLQAILRATGKLKVADAVDTAAAIAAGLRDAHNADIIHRDLKPSNIIVPTPSGLPLFSKAKISDFGVFGELLNRGLDSGVTRVGEVFGTPTYMAPEQLKGEGQTRATDIYGLGIVLYEMIYGQLPFPSLSLMEMMRAKIFGTIEFPSDAEVPDDLVKVLKQCLAVDQSDRIQTADQVLVALRELRWSPVLEYRGPNTVWEPAEQVTDVSQAPLSPFQEARSSSPPEASAKASSAVKFLAYAVIGFFAVPLLGTIIWALWVTGLLNWGTFIGIVLVMLGLGASLAISKLVKARQTEIGKDAQDILFGSKSRDFMTQSLAIQVDALVAKITRQDDMILGMSLALMVREYADSNDAQGRGDKLMNVVQLLEKISTRLSPWYVRHDKLVAAMVGLVGILSGITTITIAVLNTVKGK